MGLGRAGRKSHCEPISQTCENVKKSLQKARTFKHTIRFPCFLSPFLKVSYVILWSRNIQIAYRLLALSTKIRFLSAASNATQRTCTVKVYENLAFPSPTVDHIWHVAHFLINFENIDFRKTTSNHKGVVDPKF